MPQALSGYGPRTCSECARKKSEEASSRVFVDLTVTAVERERRENYAADVVYDELTPNHTLSGGQVREDLQMLL